MALRKRIRDNHDSPKENEPSIKRRKTFPSYIQSIHHQIEKENQPFIFTNYRSDANTFKSSKHISRSSSADSPTKSYTHSGLQKLTAFWMKMVGNSESPDTIQTAMESPVSTTNSDLTEMTESYPSFDSFDNGTDSFDFHSLLKNLTAECERKEEEDELNNLRKQIEKLNINLTPGQIEEIINAEQEMNEMIEKIRELKLDELNGDSRQIAMILSRLTQLTLSESEGEEDGEFDIASDTESDETKENEDDQRLLSDDVQVEQLQRRVAQTQMNDIDAVNGGNVAKRPKLKQKSIVHKVSKFMLSVLMVGAPLFYYYVH